MNFAKNKKIFICISKQQGTYEIMPLWNISTTELDPLAYKSYIKIVKINTKRVSHYICLVLGY